jgi:glycine/sarcosine N-methyltransferase
MYNILSEDYDRFVNWQNRLAVEIPFILGQLQTINAVHLLDTATGTGMHAIALAQHGYRVTGTDISHGMIEQARRNADIAGVQVRFEIAAFSSIATKFGDQSLDAILCLGNSLPHLLSRDDLDRTLQDFANCLQPRGLLIIQNRNFDAVVANRKRWMEPQSYKEDSKEWLFQRFYDFDTDGLLTFNMVILKRQGHGNWVQNVVSSRMRPILTVELMLSLSEAGFVSPMCYGDMTGASYNHDTSPNLVVVVRKKSLL